MKTTLILLTICFAMSSCESEQQKQVESQKPETLVTDFSDEKMDAAIAKAKTSTDEFLRVLEAGDADSFSVKAPITDENGTEHFWLTDVSYANGTFTGLVGNDPGMVKNVEFGQEWQIERNEISDWMYVRGEMIHGGFTIDPLLDSYPAAEAEALREKLVR